MADSEHAQAATPGSAAGSEADRTPPPMADSPAAAEVTIDRLMNAHYHAGREAFLDNVHRWFMFGVIAFGAAALVDILPSDHRDWLKALFSALAAMIGALDLTFDLSNRARSHALMKRRYFDLMAEMREGVKEPTEAQAALERLSGDEEPPYRVLLLASWNLAQEAVFGPQAQVFEIGWLDLLTKDLFRRPGFRRQPRQTSIA